MVNVEDFLLNWRWYIVLAKKIKFEKKISYHKKKNQKMKEKKLSDWYKQIRTSIFFLIGRRLISTLGAEPPCQSSSMVLKFYFMVFLIKNFYYNNEIFFFYSIFSILKVIFNFQHFVSTLQTKKNISNPPYRFECFMKCNCWVTESVISCLTTWTASNIFNILSDDSWTPSFIENKLSLSFCVSNNRIFKNDCS